MLLPLVLLATLNLIFLFLFLLSKNRKNKAFRPPPGPKGLPIIGNLLEFAHSNTHTYFATLSKTYGPIFRLRLINQEIVVIQCPKLAKEIFQAQDKNFRDRPLPLGRKKLSYNGLDIAFGPYNEYLKEMKMILTMNYFSTKKVQSFSQIRREEASRLIEKVSSLASASKVVNLSDLVMDYATSNSGRIAFRKRYEEELGSRYHSLLHDVEEMFTAFFFSDHIYLGSCLDWLTGKYSKLENVFKELDDIYEQIIKDHFCPNKLNSEEEDITDILLQLMNDNSFAFKLTLDHVKAILMNLFAGGANATTAGVIWAIVELVKNPNSMKRVQKEIRNASQHNGYVEESDLSKMKYFKAVVKETFRLHPPSPLLISRETIHKCKIEGYDILPKTTIFINAWSMGRDPEYWKDSEKFMPERFLDGSMEVDQQAESIAMIPFGGGKRMCPGFNFGLANLELALANLLYAFDWDLPLGLNKEDIDCKVHPGLVMHKKNNLCLVAKLI